MGLVVLTQGAHQTFNFSFLTVETPMSVVILVLAGVAGVLLTLFLLLVFLSWLRHRRDQKD